MYQYRAEITTVVDGDTFDAIVDLGFNIMMNRRFRLLGINAPESRTRDLNEKSAGIISKEALKNLIEGKIVTLDSKKKDKYGRWLAIVYVDGMNINEHMLNSGFAKEYMV